MLFIITASFIPVNCCPNYKTINFFWRRRNVCMWRCSINRRTRGAARRGVAQNPTRHSTTRNTNPVDDQRHAERPAVVLSRSNSPVVTDD